MLRTWLLIGASGTCLVSFTWALRGHFQHPGRMPRAMQALSGCSLLAYCLQVWILATRRPLPAGSAVAGGLFLLSFALFWWSVATTRSLVAERRLGIAHGASQPRFVEAGGPYRLVRHPFYLSYMMFWLGTACAAGGAQWLAAIALMAWYMQIARREERDFAGSPIAGLYASYRQRTGMLLPVGRGTMRRSAAAINSWWTGLTGSAELYSAVLTSQELKAEQAAILARTTFFFAILGLGSISLFGFDFRAQFNGFMLLAGGWIVLSYLAWVAASIAWLRSRDHDRFLAVSTYLVIGIGAAWGLLVNLFAAVATDDQKGTLIGLIMALVSTPMLGVPVSVGLGFWIPIAIFCAVAILYTLEPIHAGAVASFIGFLAFSLVGLLFLNKTILERSIGRINLQHQHRTLSVFLREYEQNASDWLWETDAEGRLHNISPRMSEVLGRGAAILQGRLIERLFDAAAGPEDARELAVLLQQKAAFRDLPVTLERAGETRWLSLTGHPVFDEFGVYCGFRGVGADVTEARRSQERIAFMAGHDGLTRLMNRQNFLERVEAACAGQVQAGQVHVGQAQAGRQQQLALLMIDLDQFKPVNDDYGHGAGDAVLVGIAERIAANIRHHDFAARLGGDEFAVLLHVAHAEDAIEVTERLLGAMRTRICFSSILIHPRASIGIALYPRHAASAGALMTRADLALYEAKHGGRNTYRFFEEGMDAAYRGRLRMQADLSVALERGELFVAYQPIFDVACGHIVSSEALVRWRHPTRGTVSAGEFIPLAEETGMIDAIGAFVLDRACRAAMDWGGRLPVVVNLSPRQLRANSFLQTLESSLRQSGLPPAMLGLEVTETVFLDLTERTTRQIDGIRKLGVRLILDDFGTGYSSLTYIRTFDFDGLKIDAAFTRDLPGSRKVAAIVRTIARLAHDLGMSLTAEGVESRE